MKLIVGFNLLSCSHCTSYTIICEQCVDIGDTCSTEALDYNDNGLCNNAQNKEKISYCTLQRSCNHKILKNEKCLLFAAYCMYLFRYVVLCM